MPMEGLRIIAFSHRELGRSVDRLAALPVDMLRAFKVRSGEHLAAILLTACYGSAPTAVDTSGEVDFIFDTADTLGLSSAGRQVVEVKSVPGTFRTFDASLDRAPGTALGREHRLRLESASDVVAAIDGLVQTAAAKTALCEANGRHAFVIVPPFERFAVELVSGMVGPVLPDVALAEPLDVLWVLWYPEQLTAWARDVGAWTQVIFDAVDENEDAGVDDVLMTAEADLLSRTGHEGSSPFQFRVSSVITDV
jgi:hypothetical protein